MTSVRLLRRGLLVTGSLTIAAGLAALVWSIRADRATERAIQAAAVPLDCSHVRVPAQQACAPGHPRVADVVVAGNQLGVGPGHCAPVVDRAGVERRIAPALDALASVSIAELSIRERVVAQNAALRIASCLLDGGTAPPGAVEIAATREVRRLALPAAALEEIGVEPREVEAWLGPRATWIAREPLMLVLQHEGGYGMTRVFTPVFYGPSAALFSQLVAVDDSGAPRATSIVGEIEARTPAIGPPDRGCVVKLDPARLRCDPGALKVAALHELPPSSFVFRAATGVGCKSCHSSGPFLTRDARDGGTPSSERSAVVLARLVERLRLLERRESGAR